MISKQQRSPLNYYNVLLELKLSIPFYRIYRCVIFFLKLIFIKPVFSLFFLQCRFNNRVIVNSLDIIFRQLSSISYFWKVKISSSLSCRNHIVRNKKAANKIICSPV